jgi:ribosomal protein S3AE
MAKTKGNVKKSFYDVSVPLISSKVSIYGESAEALDGKVVNLDLTRSLKGKSLELKFKVKAQDGKLIGEPTGIELAGSFIRRMIRKGVDYSEDSFIVQCKDGKALIKPFMITRQRVSRSVLKHLRNEAKKMIEAHVKSRTLMELFSEITANKIQRDLSYKLKKIYPLALCEIRVFRVIVENKKLETAA